MGDGNMSSDIQKAIRERFFGHNFGYVMELFEKYQQNPNSIDDEMKAYFRRLENEVSDKKSDFEIPVPPNMTSSKQVEKILAAVKLAEDIRANGHQYANINPLIEQLDNNQINPAIYGLSQEDLEAMPASYICTDAPPYVTNGWEAFHYLKDKYTQTIAFEYDHVHDSTEKEWLRKKVETDSLLSILSNPKRINVLKRLTEVEEFEKFLHRTFVGQKRFSIEGLDSMIPLLDELISHAVQDGAETINIGMAHRGRLNVLAHVLDKPYEKIFAEFQHAPNKELVPSEGSVGINYGWTGDVKYHLGLDRQIKEENTVKAKLSLANNPSHLEYVGAVVEGFTRAAQDNREVPGYPTEKPMSSLAILIHGDAAFPGEGIVAETLNLSRLPGYRTGGSIHIIANNSIGFTTEARDSRSTRYASDLAKGFEIPIIHVNADDPEACLAAAKLAAEYRAVFQKDFLIDLIGYRRFGHNEMDEPMTTNPLMYTIIHKHPTVKSLYSKALTAKGILTDEAIQEMEKTIIGNMSSVYEKVSEKRKEPILVPTLPHNLEKGLPILDTAVPMDRLRNINEELLKWPEQFLVFKKLEKILQRRAEAFEEKGKVDWAHAETLAFASVLSDGVPIRLTGQDSERGTFAQRNLVLHHSGTGEKYSPLHMIPSANASFAIHNSPLSEEAVVGFEYGYNIFAPDTLVIWEAQYGDFANAAQVLFDQFIAAGRAKWGQKSGLVLLLPHGYEGQGPEHSSGRVERFLQSAAENNWTVANLTSAAQYFHILRRQAVLLSMDEVRPLVIMSPKSLLRHPLVPSAGEELSNGRFMPVLEHPGLGSETEKVERLLFCSGKIAIDLAEKIHSTEEFDWLHILRIEEIYPFPKKEILERMGRYPNLKEICWIQEEPKNMGAWSFVEPRLQEMSPEGIKVEYIGRRRRSSPAEGDPNVHKFEQATMIERALSRKSKRGK